MADQLLTGRRRPRAVLVFNPGQGHLPALIGKALAPERITLAGRDLVQPLPRLRIPEADRPVVAARGDRLAVGAEGDAIHEAFVRQKEAGGPRGRPFPEATWAKRSAKPAKCAIKWAYKPANKGAK